MDDIWESYQRRLDGVSKRDRTLRREASYIARKAPDSLSYQKVTIDGNERWLTIINSDNLTLKTLLTMPGEHLLGGELVEFADNYWIVTSVDAHQELYAKAQMEQCNYLLKWIVNVGDGQKEIIERHCIVSDGTKYLTGETTSNYAENGMVLGDTRIAVTLTRDGYTAKLGRKDRFLIDDADTNHVLSYRITKPFKIGGVYNGHGAMSFVLQECNTEEDDNLELHIADYYKHFPRETADGIEDASDELEGKKVWL